MNRLFVVDRKDYSEGMPISRVRQAVRGVIIRDGRILMQKSADGEFKIPGGGLDAGEDDMQALVREILEETGYTVDVTTADPIGEVEERHLDIFLKDSVYIAISRYYFCQVGDEVVPPSMTASEMKKGFHPVWATLEEIIAGNRKHEYDWIARDTRVLKYISERGLAQIRSDDEGSWG